MCSSKCLCVVEVKYLFLAMFLDFEMLPKCCILVDIVRHYQGRGYKDETTHLGTQYLNKHILTFYFRILPESKT